MNTSRRRGSMAALTLALAAGCWALAVAAADDAKPESARPPQRAGGAGASGADSGAKSGESAKQDKADGRAELAKFMRAKLGASSKVLDGLCTEDFDEIIAGASKLKEMSAAEEWRASTDVMYRQHSAEFRGTVDDLLEAAKKKNLDGAALAWTRSTLSCIECHRWVRATLVSEQ